MDQLAKSLAPLLHEPLYLLFFALGISLLLITALAIILLSLRSKTIQLNTSRKKDIQHISTLTEEATLLKVKIAKLTALLASEKKNHQDKINLLEEAKSNLRLQFESLAQQIFEEKSEKFGTENKEKIQALLHPLQEQIASFQKRMDSIQSDDIRERTSLKSEIVHLRELNQQINREAINLTRALKGDKKLQGNWGELILEKTLEYSGLRKDKEYSIQKGYRSNENELLKPDVVIHLPDGKNIIIDSKVPLSAWEKYINSQNDDEKNKHLKDHLYSIRHHINSLSRKNYEKLPMIHTLDFVLLFIPIDSSYITAYEADNTLFDSAYKNSIIIVTPTTLLATLKTIENLWRYEQQNQNAQEIAHKAGLIFDKLCGFLEDMEKIGKQLETCHNTYESALNKLSSGRGNIIQQAEKLGKLGVKPKKDIPQSLARISDQDMAN